MIEIEIKRSLSDFKADAKKPSRVPIVRQSRTEKLPKQFYYLAPFGLIPKIEPLLPDWAGLMSGPDENCYGIAVVRTAPNNPDSQRLTVKECCRLVLMVNNHALSEAESRYASLSNFREGHWSYPKSEYEI